MKKDFADKWFNKKQTAKASGKGRWVIFIFIFFVTVSGMGYVAYIKKLPQIPIVYSSYINRLKLWVAERKEHLHQGIVKAKQLATNKETDNEIHFEFYTALPNMQVTLSDQSIKEKNSSNNASILKLPAKAMIVSADQLEQELSEEFRKSEHKK